MSPYHDKKRPALWLVYPIIDKRDRLAEMQVGQDYRYGIECRKAEERNQY